MLSYAVSRSEYCTRNNTQYGQFIFSWMQQAMYLNYRAASSMWAAWWSNYNYFAIRRSRRLVVGAVILRLFLCDVVFHSMNPSSKSYQMNTMLKNGAQKAARPVVRPLESMVLRVDGITSQGYLVRRWKITCAVLRLQAADSRMCCDGIGSRRPPNLRSGEPILRIVRLMAFRRWSCRIDDRRPSRMKAREIGWRLEGDLSMVIAIFRDLWT